MVVPVFRAVDNLYHTGNLFLHIVPAFFRRVSKSEGSLTEHFHLTVPVRAGSGVVHAHHLFMHPQFRQLISGIGITEVGRFGKEQRPCRYP